MPNKQNSRRNVPGDHISGVRDRVIDSVMAKLDTVDEAGYAARVLPGVITTWIAEDPAFAAELQRRVGVHAQRVGREAIRAHIIEAVSQRMAPHEVALIDRVLSDLVKGQD